MDDAYLKAEEIVNTPGIIQVFDACGYCRKCKQPLSGAAVDLKKLKEKIAEALRSIK